MAYVYEQQMPKGVTEEMYAFIVEQLGPEPPDGMVCHLALRTPEGLRYLDVWRSREDCDRFVEQRLHPAVGKMFRKFSFVPPAGEPPRVEPSVVDVWSPAVRARPR